MIEEIYIENFAIIEKTRINFTTGLNILTGETGAGKSIIIGALELILGSRANKDLVGIYSDRALVEASISLTQGTYKKLSDKYGIVIEESSFIVTREIYKSESSVVRLNNRRVSLNLIEDIMKDLINIHGQNENFILNDSKNYVNIIDSFRKSEIDKLINELTSYFKEKQFLLDEIDKIDIPVEELERQIDLLTYQINEIDSINLESVDFNDLENEYRKLTNLTSIKKSISIASNLYSGNELQENDIDSLLNKAISEVSKANNNDNSLEVYLKELQGINYQLSDIFGELDNYSMRTDINDERISELDSLFKALEDLKRKYGNDIPKILEYRENIQRDLDDFLNKDSKLNSYKLRVKEIESKILTKANELSTIRKSIAEKIEKDILFELQSLNFPNARFHIEINKKDKVDRMGFDKLDFLISFNLGQELKSLAKVGSGGEISRFMLALKIVMAENDKVNTLIFDEIDTGISGITADRVGEALKQLSKKYQVLLVTHLPQIAVQADTHILIDKYIENNVTKTGLLKLDDETKIQEIARLIGGMSITDKTIDAAKELLESKRR